MPQQMLAAAAAATSQMARRASLWPRIVKLHHQAMTPHTPSVQKHARDLTMI